MNKEEEVVSVTRSPRGASILVLAVIEVSGPNVEPLRGWIFTIYSSPGANPV